MHDPQGKTKCLLSLLKEIKQWTVRLIINICLLLSQKQAGAGFTCLLNFPTISKTYCSNGKGLEDKYTKTLSKLRLASLYFKNVEFRTGINNDQIFVTAHAYS
jgi:hypothetical protein